MASWVNHRHHLNFRSFYHNSAATLVDCWVPEWIFTCIIFSLVWHSSSFIGTSLLSSSDNKSSSQRRIARISVSEMSGEKRVLPDIVEASCLITLLPTPPFRPSCSRIVGEKEEWEKWWSWGREFLGRTPSDWLADQQQPYQISIWRKVGTKTAVCHLQVQIQMSTLPGHRLVW